MSNINTADQAILLGMAKRYRNSQTALSILEKEVMLQNPVLVTLPNKRNGQGTRLKKDFAKRHNEFLSEINPEEKAPVNFLEEILKGKPFHSVLQFASPTTKQTGNRNLTAYDRISACYHGKPIS